MNTAQGAKVKRLEREGTKTSPERKLEIAASNYLKGHVLARINEDADLEQVWAQVAPLAQRALTALAALDERAVRTGNKQLVADHVAANWPCPGEAPMFVWNANIGLGFVSRDDVFARPKANVWLWSVNRPGVPTPIGELSERVTLGPLFTTKAGTNFKT
jgi:hypothetical protein